jgi:hypothetical protein
MNCTELLARYHSTRVGTCPQQLTDPVVIPSSMVDSLAQVDVPVEHITQVGTVVYRATVDGRKKVTRETGRSPS